MYRVAFKAFQTARLVRTTMVAAMAAMALTLAPAQTAQAAKKKAPSKYAAYVIDVKSGKVLYSRNGTAARYPASLTKMMTLYMVFEELKKGKLTLNSRLKVSKYAAARPPSKLGLRAGSTIRVRDAILALVTKSANDVAATVAENLGGSEANFAKMMTSKARSVGMRSTTFKNASGLPNKYQKTTAKDMALLGRALQDRFPRYYKFFNTRSFKFGKRRYGNHNKLLGRVKGVDGIKTGYTRASGFNLVSNVKSRDRHIVAVVMGGRTGAARNAHMKSLIGKYLPKAKRGRRLTALVVPRAGSAPAKKASYIKLAKSMRLPQANRVRIVEMARAHAAKSAGTIQMASAYAPTQTIQMPALPKARETASNKPVQIPVRLAKAPQPKPASRQQVVTLSTASMATPPLPRAANDPIGDLSTHSRMTPVAPQRAAAPSGWQIQLGATPSMKAANKLLAKARKSNKRLLVAVLEHTETVDKNDTTLYRARFAGFKSKKAARNACRILKKQKFACLALNPS